jgi:hypothetical protein
LEAFIIKEINRCKLFADKIYFSKHFISNLNYICKKSISLFKKITAFVFLLAFAVQTFSKALVVFDYFTNTKTYAKNCENKAKPKLHCNGKCQMMKKLKQEEKKDEQNPERKAENKNEVVLSSKSFYPTLKFTISSQEINFPSITLGKANKMPRSLLRPPIC